jgi:hypothetical protein
MKKYFNTCNQLIIALRISLLLLLSKEEKSLLLKKVSFKLIALTVSQEDSIQVKHLEEKEPE